MQLYRTHVLPRLTHLAMRQKQLRLYRERVVSAHMAGSSKSESGPA